MTGKGWRLTRRGRIVAWILGLVLAWLTYRYLSAGYWECIDRGFEPVVCGM